MTKNLRTYQLQAIANVEDNLNAGIDKQLLVLATGLGKTFTAVKVIEKLGFKKVLWVTHTEELLEQSALAFLKDKFDGEFVEHVEAIGFIDWVEKHNCNFGNHSGSFKMGVIKASIFKTEGEIVMASAQTLYRRLDKMPVDMFDCIVTDEAHYFAAETFCRPLNHFTPKLLLGLTATPHRNDNLMLGNIFDKIVYEYNIGEGIRDGYLCELDAVRIKTDLSLDNVRTTAGELNQKDLSNEVNIPKRNKLVVDSYLKYASERQGIFYCVDVQHAVDLSEMFNSNGISCKPIVGDEDVTTDRKGWIREFKQGKIQVLTNCMVLTTGFDYPNLGCIGNASPTKSLTKYLQCIGRATRLKDATYVEKFKQEAIILDFVDNTSKHKLINCWELDKGKATEEKVFLTSEQKKNLIDERNRRNTKIESLFKKDERVKLLKLPKPVLSDSIRMREPATQAQLTWIEGLGYDIKNTVYTKAMCNEIISELPANKVQLEYLKNKGYDINEGATRGQYSTIEWKNRK